MSISSLHPSEPHDPFDPALAVLSDAERSEVDRLRNSPNVVAIEVIDKNGEPLMSCDQWPGISTIFANVVDSAVNIGRQLGEDGSHPVVMMRGALYDVSGISMINANIVVVYERSQKIKGKL